MYPLPHELTVELNRITSGLGIDEEIQRAIQDRVARLLLRQNRQLRQKVLRLANAMSRYAGRAETFERKMGALVGEEVALYLNKMLKKNVYVNTAERQERLSAVDRLIEEFLGESEEP